jgi:two-component system sensor histidine kinase PilS (NtrC family)
MDIVLRETDRLDALITDFLHYARPAPPKGGSVSLGELAAELREMYEKVRPPTVEARFAVDPEARAFADADQLRQLLWNLLLNAGQAMPEGGVLSLEASLVEPQERAADGRNREEAEPAPRVEICVSDTGTGIPPDVLDRIFDPFFTTKPEGSGLGLAMVHRIVEANGGQIGVESEVDAGTCFRIRLPATDPRGFAEGDGAATEGTA